MTFKEDVRDKAWLSGRLRECLCPGLSLLTIEDFKVRDEIYLGMSTGVGGRSIAPDTLFQAASISKPVFALGLMRLVEEGSLELDEDISQYLCSWSLPLGSARVSLRQLLNHSASATVDGFPGYGPGLALPSIQEILDGQAPANTPAVRIVGTPGERYSYSGGGVTIAQKVFEDRVKGRFSEAMDQYVLGPLGMQDSCFEQPLGPERSLRAAWGHVAGQALPGGWNSYPELAAAGLWTSARDLAKLGIAVMRRYAGLDSPLVLRPESVAEMMRPRLPDQGPDHISVGIGWFCEGRGDDLTFGHNGGNTGYVAQICLRPKDGSGLVFLANASDAYPLLAQVMAAHKFSLSL